MEPNELDIAIEELELRVERLRSLYEQFFMGIEKTPPAVVHKDVERRIYLLRRTKIRNTAKRFKVQTIIQRFNTFSQYWMRIMREIENGTYRRHVLRAEKTVGVSPIASEAERRRRGLGPDASESIRPELDPVAARTAVEQELSKALEDSFAGPAPMPDLGDFDLDEPLDAPPRPLPKPARASSPQPRPLPRGGPVPAPARLISQPAPPPSQPRAMSTPGPAAPAGAPPRVVSPLAAVAGRGLPPKLPPRMPPAAGTPARPAPPSAARPAPPSAAGPRPVAPAAAPAARPAAPAVPAASPAASAISRSRVEQIHEKLAAAKQQTRETGQVSVEALARKLEASASELRKKHVGKQVDFDVVVKDGKAILKPILR